MNCPSTLNLVQQVGTGVVDLRYKIHRINTNLNTMNNDIHTQSENTKLQHVCKLSPECSLVGWVAILDNVPGVYTAE